MHFGTTNHQDKTPAPRVFLDEYVTGLQNTVEKQSVIEAPKSTEPE